MARLKVGARVTITVADNVPISLRRRFIVGQTTGTVTHQVRPSGVSGYGYTCDVQWDIAGPWGDTIPKRHAESELTVLGQGLAR